MCAFEKVHIICRERLHRCCGKHPSRATVFFFLSPFVVSEPCATQIYLKGLSEKSGSKIYGKAEFQNPGGSVKDRAALGIIEAAEADGRCVRLFSFPPHAISSTRSVHVYCMYIHPTCALDR